VEEEEGGFCSICRGMMQIGVSEGAGGGEGFGGWGWHCHGVGLGWCL
jgi:hypothetical protein